MKRRKREKNLIPVEKSQRIIRLEHRGPKKNHSKMIAIILSILAVLCMLYCMSIFFFMGYGTKFFLIWGVMAVMLGGAAFCFGHSGMLDRVPKVIRKGFCLCLLIGILFFGIVEGFIINDFHAKAKPGADYVIVLGAQWKSHGPSYVLQKRLDKAVEYLQANPDTKVIVSGGQGSNEPISEAAGMAEYLENAGISQERILQEDRSTNTNENLSFSSTFLDKNVDEVVIVTNNFHVFRAVKIAQKQGYTHVEGLAARSYPAMVPNNLLREFFGVVKDFCVGNL